MLRKRTVGAYVADASLLTRATVLNLSGLTIICPSYSEQTMGMNGRTMVNCMISVDTASAQSQRQTFNFSLHLDSPGSAAGTDRG
jgi:hypothetical protein